MLSNSKKPALVSLIACTDGLSETAKGSPDRDHSFDRTSRRDPDFIRYFNGELFLKQGVTRVFQGDLIHVWTAHAAKSKHLFVRIGRGDVVAHRAFGKQQVAR